jgi:hypothetical protein
MFHGASLSALADIAEMGFDLSACRPSKYSEGLLVSNIRYHSRVH